MSLKKFYITTSIAYANAFPHIGFALELIQADVLARYHRILGDDILFLTGTDEHGLKIAKAAEKVGREPEEFVDEISDRFKRLTKILNISNSDFIRTTDRKRHWPVVEKVWLELRKNGDIYKKKYKGLYCVGCEAFIQEKDLKNGKCPFHQKEPEIIEEENYFFRLSKYAPKIERILREDKIKIIPGARKNEILSFIGQGIEDVSCSRLRKKLHWGIPVPDDHSQIIYVWFEALVNYISALGYGESGNNFKKYWPADVHCVGKDIFRFHSLLWPAMLLSLNLELPKAILVHGFINVNGQKMSKSLGNVIDSFELVEKYGTEAVRYFLLREIPPTEDGDFTYQKFEERYNSDLANGLGNLLARVRTLAEISNFPACIPQNKKRESVAGGQFPISNKFPNFNFQKSVDKILQDYKKGLEEFKFNKSLKAIWKLVSFSDKYIEEEKPWEKKENSREVLDDLLVILENIAELLEPFLPETAKRIKKEIKRDEKTGKFASKKGKILFPRLGQQDMSPESIERSEFGQDSRNEERNV